MFLNTRKQASALETAPVVTDGKDGELLAVLATTDKKDGGKRYTPGIRAFGQTYKGSDLRAASRVHALVQRVDPAAKVDAAYLAVAGRIAAAYGKADDAARAARKADKPAKS